MRAAIILLALVGAALAVPKKVERIVGGSTTTIQQYPFMSSMIYGQWGIFWYQACGGSLITTTTVLSAAHCFLGDSPAEWRVRLGTSFPETGGTEFFISKFTLHQGFTFNTMDSDVALVHLSSPAVLSESVQVASIAGPTYNLADGTLLTAVGWGSLSSGGSFPSQLQHVDINQINQELCAVRYAYLKTQPGYSTWPDITPGMLCAGIQDVGGKDACQGDSGGPLLHQGNIVYGITSWGLGCADAFYPGVNARVSQYSNWIVSNA